jgi:DNA-binding transcriptional regulator YiaG
MKGNTTVKTRVSEWAERNPLRKWRKSHGLSMRAAGALLGVNQWSVSNWEYGNSIPNSQNMNTIISVTEILDIREKWSEWYNRGPQNGIVHVA